ncbi:L-dopachrome tautomerase-related protein [Lamprocystis purpurea]|uniref:L-dopachrome tautomerase-related protein n=1 Tax=Lamprocystis purpurea TaxID=61598 RepID=UPI0003800DDB|nr:L-dopachrome tautomerase-related protein [Lamprocystis purpurea]
MRPLFAALLLALPLTQPLPAWADEQQLPGSIEVVAELPVNPGNLAVTPDGRVFATVHQFRRGTAQLIEITGPASYRPWPDAAWNGSFGSGPDVLNSALGIRVDRQGRLWVLDNGLGDPPLMPHQTPKLLAFALADGKPVYRYDFPPETGPAGSFLNDLAVDDARGFVYIADVGGSQSPALVVLDLNQRRSRRFTASPALQAEDVDLVVEGRVIGPRGEDGKVKPARIALNPITLSADGETLFFGAMNGETWYQVPARLLREGATDAVIAAAITKAGPKPVSDGAATDAAGHHYFTDLGSNAITVLGPDGRLETLVQDDRLLWPDALSFGEPGWLYIAVNQLHRAPFLNGGVEGAVPPFRIMRVYTGQD